LIAVFDVDSEAYGTFDEVDAAELESILHEVFSKPA